MATISEIRQLAKKPNRFQLMRQELLVPGTIAKHEEEEEKIKKKEDKIKESTLQDKIIKKFNG